MISLARFSQRTGQANEDQPIVPALHYRGFEFLCLLYLEPADR